MMRVAGEVGVTLPQTDISRLRDFGSKFDFLGGLEDLPIVQKNANEDCRRPSDF